MPSPTRTITPQESPMQQPKRKLESTVSTENATGGAKKKEKAISDVKSDPSKHSIAEVMEIEQSSPSIQTPLSENKRKEEERVEPPPPDVQESLKKIGELCDELMEKTDKKKEEEKIKKPTSKEETKVAPVKAKKEEQSGPATAKKEPIKKISSPGKRDMIKHKTSDLSTALTSVGKEKEQQQPPSTVSKSQNVTEKKESSTAVEESAGATEKPKTTEKRRSRILETAEKFQNMNNQNNEKYKKFSIPGVSVGNFKKEFERKASLTEPGRKISLDKTAENDSDAKSKQQPVVKETPAQKIPTPTTAVKNNVNTAIVSNNSEQSISTASSASKIGDELNANSSRSSVLSTTLEDARRSMENSIALLQKAKSEATRTKDVENLCARTESVTLDGDREKKLQAAREIIGNAIPPSRLIGFRKPPLYGLHGRSISGGVVPSSPRPYTGRQLSSTLENAVLDKGRLWVLPSCAIVGRTLFFSLKIV